MNWMTLVFFVGLLWISPEQTRSCTKDKLCRKLQDCLSNEKKHYVVSDNFNGVIHVQHSWKQNESGCIIFLANSRRRQKCCNKKWPQMETKGGAFQVYITKWHINKKVQLTVLKGKGCVAKWPDLRNLECNCRRDNKGSCQVTCLQTENICDQATYSETFCNKTVPQFNNRYIINLTEPTESFNCFKCDNPAKKPEEELDPEELNDVGLKFEITEGEDIDPVQAANVMKKMGDLSTLINTSSAALNVGEGVSGVLVRETERKDVEEVSFGYQSSNDSIYIIDDRETLAQYSRSVTVSKEAFEQAVSSNISIPFAAMLRFLNMAKDEKNSTVLGNEVLAVEMGTNICNLTDKICINFWNIEYEGIPSCHSWNGEGNQPYWTDDGCVTIKHGDNITCQCSHLTFFAVLLAPPNETISTSDLKHLTVITEVGCGLSMLFLAIVLFMHCLLRKRNASTATSILIHLVLAMFMLNLTFLVNNYVPRLKSSVGCKIMAAVMHYFMLATFTWFAVQAFNLCLQLRPGGRIVVRHLILKVCIISWGVPSVVAIVLVLLGKYGEQVIHTDDPKENVVMCWITDRNVHYIVNIGYYAVVFLFTFTTFIIIVSWLLCVKGTKAGNAQVGGSGRSILTIMGLCCMLGISWGFAFFAHGVLLIPSYYTFTVLNSFQGFFLFIYYYKTSHSGDMNGGLESSNNSSMSTLKTDQDGSENPYMNLPIKR
uniref:adhesion G-protein coupled receptor G5-like n=1 Tax=Semicossyphus pulcher TaxID=241346 RepID=UPI0037E72C3B